MLGFNTPGAEPQFLILQELEDGFMYMLASKPFGPVNFVYRDLVNLPEEEEELPAEEPKKKGK